MTLSDLERRGVIFFTRISLITLVPFVPTKYCRRSVFLGVSHALYRKGGAQAQPQNWVALGPAPCGVRINRRNPLRTPFGAELCTKYDTCEGLVFRGQPSLHSKGVGVPALPNLMFLSIYAYTLSYQI